MDMIETLLNFHAYNSICNLVDLIHTYRKMLEHGNNCKYTGEKLMRNPTNTNKKIFKKNSYQSQRG